jgi:hypothetical protein
MLRKRYIGFVLMTRRRLVRIGVEMLVHAIVVHDGDVAGLPIVADVVVNLVAGSVENIEGGFVDVAVLL